MTEHDDTPTAGAPTTRRGEATPAPRALLTFRSGPCTFGVYADEADAVVSFDRAAPLPFAPPPVLGVITARGRMRTLIDSLRLLRRETNQADSEQPETTPTLAVILKGDEQLALAVEHEAGAVQISPSDVTPPDPPQDFARGTVEHEGARVHVLDPARLFDAAVRGAERRRPR